MKRSVFWISLLVLFMLAGCNVLLSTPTQTGDGGVASTATLTDIEIQTQIALLITALPTSTEQVLETTPTEALPTLPVETQAPTETSQPTDTPAEQPTATVTPEPTTAATATPLGTAAVTLTPSGSETPAATPTNTVPPSPSFTPPANDPRSRLGNPTTLDPMDNARTWVWPTGTDQYTTGSFSNGSMAVTALTDTDGWRMANPLGRDFANIYLEGTFRTGACKGSDHYGLILRVPVLHEPEQGYLFGVTCDGRYSLRKWDGLEGTKGKMTWLVNWTTSSAIATGANQTNRLGIMAVGNRLILYANGSLLTEVSDAMFPDGYFGVFVGSDETDNLTVLVDEMALWENPQP